MPSTKMSEKKSDSSKQSSENSETNKEEPTRKRSSIVFQCNDCGLSFQCSNSLNDHILTKHGKTKPITPSSSPPRKIFEKDQNGTEEEMLDLDDVEITVEKELSVAFLLQKRINELETVVATLLKEKEKEEESRSRLEQQIDTLLTPKASNIPKHLKVVNAKHLSKLRGFKLIYKALANGRCLQNCLAVHGYEEEDEGIEIKKIVNHHIADNWDYYYNKVGLPFKEIAGVGADSKVFKKKTEQEMIDFLRSDSKDALAVYSNSHDVLAMANLFNIHIHIFTYKGNEDRWSHVSPDPIMSDKAEIKFGNWLPDMYLYHSDNSHYDLLVGEKSRLAQGFRDDNFESSEWKTVGGRRQKSRSEEEALQKEKLLIEDEQINDDMVIEEATEELILKRGKSSGHRRTAPQSDAENVNNVTKFTCKKCDLEFESQGLLDAHMNTHESNKPKFYCEPCDESFQKESDLKHHVKVTHERIQEQGNWNCNDCSFQANI